MGKKITVDAAKLASIVLENKSKIGDPNWSFYIDTDGNFDCRHQTENNSEWMEFLGCYSFWNDCETLNSSVEDLADWLKNEAIQLYKIELQINYDIVDVDEKIDLIWAKKSSILTDEIALALEQEHNVYINTATGDFTNGARDDVYGWQPIPAEWLTPEKTLYLAYTEITVYGVSWTSADDAIKKAVQWWKSEGEVFDASDLSDVKTLAIELPAMATDDDFISCATVGEYKDVAEKINEGGAL